MNYYLVYKYKLLHKHKLRNYINKAVAQTGANVKRKVT